VAQLKPDTQPISIDRPSLQIKRDVARIGQHGRIAEARSLLQSVYARFNEGFETADLKTAKACLDSLR
jgi:hypothetical protein